MKALYVKLRKEAQQVKRIRELYRSNLEEDLQTLDNLAYQAATKYDFFGDRWVNLDGEGENIGTTVHFVIHPHSVKIYARDLKHPLREMTPTLDKIKKNITG